MSAEAVVTAQQLTKIYAGHGKRGDAVVAAHEISFTLYAGEILGLIGESGSGKTTIGRLLTGIEKPTTGSLQWSSAFASGHGQVQMVFQDPYAALNPFNPIRYTLTRPLMNFRHSSPAEALDQARTLLTTVQLTPPDQFLVKRPHQLSGGQRQRIVIARALAASPQVIVADEPVSMLDVSIRAEVLQLLRKLMVTRQVASILYITHDLMSARSLAQRVIVLYRGRMVEVAKTGDLLANPRHPYTQMLFASIPNPRRAFRGEALPIPVSGSLAPSSATGCPFAPRCPWVEEACQQTAPRLEPLPDGRLVSCHVVTRTATDGQDASKVAQPRTTTP